MNTIVTAIANVDVETAQSKTKTAVPQSVLFAVLANRAECLVTSPGISRSINYIDFFNP